MEESIVNETNSIIKKIDELEREKFILEMKDRLNHDDFAELNRLTSEIVELKNKLNKQTSMKN